MSNCTIVTCYYRFPSKHTFSQYDEWMTNFLTTVDTNMVIYCDADWAEKLRMLRYKFASKTHIIIYNIPEMRCASQEILTYWERDWRRDPEQHYHNPLLYILWNEKTEMVKRAIDANPFNTEFFCWCDIGCFRSTEQMHMFTEWPASSFLNTASRDKMYMLNIEPFQHGDQNVEPNGLTKPFTHKARIGGTIFLGHISTWHTWHQVYYDVMKQYMKCDYFTGKDQNIMATIASLYPMLVRLVRPTYDACDGDPWFYLQRYFLTRQ